jgi:predicted amidohydrolase YtcJ
MAKNEPFVRIIDITSTINFKNTCMNTVVKIQLRRIFILFFLPGAMILLSSCNKVKPGKLALLNGKVYTVNPKMPWAEAVVVDSNTIVFVGSTSDAKKYIGDSTKVIDLNGKMVLPGFVESHMHLSLSNLLSQSVFLDANGIREQWLDVIRKTVKENPNKKYFLFLNFRPIIFGPEGPKKEDLDAIDRQRPIIVIDGSIHNAWVNSKAYELAGITRDTPDPLPGGHYYKRDKQGNPSGFCVFKEMEIGHTRRYIGAPDSYFLPPESEKMSVESLIKGYTMG